MSVLSFFHVLSQQRRGLGLHLTNILHKTEDPIGFITHAYWCYHVETSVIIDKGSKNKDCWVNE